MHGKAIKPDRNPTTENTMKNFTVISSDELYSDEESGITAYEIMIMLQDDSRILRDNIKVYETKLKDKKDVEYLYQMRTYLYYNHEDKTYRPTSHRRDALKYWVDHGVDPKELKDEKRDAKREKEAEEMFNAGKFEGLYS